MLFFFGCDGIPKFTEMLVVEFLWQDVIVGMARLYFLVRSGFAMGKKSFVSVCFWLVREGGFFCKVLFRYQVGRLFLLIGSSKLIVTPFDEIFSICHCSSLLGGVELVLLGVPPFSLYEKYQFSSRLQSEEGDFSREKPSPFFCLAFGS